MSGERRACVVGHPVAHSRSPLIHGHWLAEHSIAGSYVGEDVGPGDFVDFLGRLRHQGYVGCNVTIPHKERALDVVAAADETARAVGAVNTVWFEDGRMVGSNTDVGGFLASLDADLPGWDAHPASALVLGAGGAARAVVHALLTRGWRTVVVVNRSIERAGELTDRFGSRVMAAAWDALPGVLPTADLLVNTTALGMHGQPPLDIDLAPLKPGAVVTDIVYVPLETPLLAAARRRGHPVVDGLGMLLHQAVPGFARWFGVTPEVTPALRARVEADLERDAA